MSIGQPISIETERLTVRRDGHTILRGVSLHIEPGQSTCIIGPNGAGKSTLMAALIGLIPREGGVRLEDKELARLRRRDIARRIAYVPQSHEGYLGFRVIDIIESGRYAHLEPLQSLGPKDRDAIAGAVSACRLDGLLDRDMETLSGGERQKVWIAAALAQQTPALLLDEPTTALDPAHQAELIRIMRDYAARGNTLVVICHDLNIAIALGGRIVALQRGELFFDEPASIMEDTERLGELFQTRLVLHHDSGGTPSLHLCLG